MHRPRSQFDNTPLDRLDNIQTICKAIAMKTFYELTCSDGITRTCAIGELMRVEFALGKLGITVINSRIDIQLTND